MSSAKQTLFGWAAIILLLLIGIYGAHLYSIRTRLLAELSLNSGRQVRVVECAPHGRIMADLLEYSAEYWEGGKLLRSESIFSTRLPWNEARITNGREKIVVELNGTPAFEYTEGKWAALFNP